MKNYTIEQIDYLREKADISYEDAIALLEHYDGDLARCLVDLERHGRIRQPGLNQNKAKKQETWDWQRQDHDNHRFGGQGRPRAFVMNWDIVKQYLFSRITVTRGSMVVANLTIMYLLIASLVAPHLMFFSVLTMFLMGYRIKWCKDEAQSTVNREQQVYDFVDKAAKNIKRTANSFAEAVKHEVKKAQWTATCTQDSQPETVQEPQAAPQQEPQVQPVDPEDTDPSEMTIE